MLIKQFCNQDPMPMYLSTLYLVDLECNPCSRNDDLLNAVHIAEHPLIVQGVGAGITKKHTVETIHEVVIPEGVRK